MRPSGATTKEEKLLARMAMLANIILAGSGTVCLLALLYIIYYQGWPGQKQSLSWTGVLLYYVVPALLATLLFASLRLRASHKVSIALLVCSVSATVYALEIGLTLWRSSPSVRRDEDRRTRAAAAQAMGFDFDTRSRREVVRDLVRQGADVIPWLSAEALLKERRSGSVHSPISIDGVEVLPLTAIANKLIVLCNESGRFKIFRSDRHGFNNPQNVWERGRADIVAVGDSFTQGWCVDDGFVSIIRERYPATLNLGTSGSGPLIMLATLKEYARAVRPKVVLWCYFEGNDLKDLSVERKSPLLRRYLTKGFSQDLIARQIEIDRALADYLETVKDRSDLSIKLEEIGMFIGEHREIRKVQETAKRIIKLASIRTRLGLAYGTSNPDADPPRRLRGQDRELVALLYGILVEARRSIDEWGGTLYFVYLPTWSSYPSEESGADPVPPRVLSAAKKAGLPIIDLHRAFERQTDPLALFPFRIGGHYNEEGHELVAAEILRSIKDPL